MKQLLTTAALLFTLTSFGQLFMDGQAGMTSRLRPTVYANVGYAFTDRDMNGITIAATVGIEAGYGTSYGAQLGWLAFNRWHLYVGGAQYTPLPAAKYYEAKPMLYPVGGILYKYPNGRGTFDVRWHNGGVAMTLGVRIGNNFKD